LARQYDGETLVAPRTDSVDSDSAALADTAIPKWSHRRTLQYMAPEQLAGTAVARPPTSTQTGVVLYEMLTGRRLYPGPTWWTF